MSQTENKYEMQRGLFQVLMKHGADLPEQQGADARFKFMADTKLMRIVFHGIYKHLVADGDMKPIEEMPPEYKKELWEIAYQFMPQKSVEERTRYCKSIMVVLWFLNNE